MVNGKDGGDDQALVVVLEYCLCNMVVRLLKRRLPLVEVAGDHTAFTKEQAVTADGYGLHLCMYPIALCLLPHTEQVRSWIVYFVFPYIKAARRGLRIRLGDREILEVILRDVFLLLCQPSTLANRLRPTRWKCQ